MPQAHGDVGRIGISGKTVKRYQRRVAIRLILVALAVTICSQVAILQQLEAQCIPEFKPLAYELHQKSIWLELNTLRMVTEAER
jgi:hypothetical protein